jgi:hypothetical protein
VSLIAEIFCVLRSRQDATAGRGKPRPYKTCYFAVAPAEGRCARLGRRRPHKSRRKIRHNSHSEATKKLLCLLGRLGYRLGYRYALFRG